MIYYERPLGPFLCQIKAWQRKQLELEHGKLDLSETERQRQLSQARDEQSQLWRAVFNYRCSHTDY